ncbi:amino acid ABC transporter substrate-binding protein [Poseidonocella sp. HB161398]|uniref:amino acid ABC transporter substrate-binding protein n=1 Tax=Poseidonocella sp. HB161398 TaxID=2320855 RepID=UPI001107B6F9|nr:amino acid ABC transporter substrate-binding protein [Poseidonocella sp. HB161398]
MKKPALRALAVLCGAALSLATLLPASADTLDEVKERGALNCTGHNGSYLGLAEVDDTGNWKGLDIDFCRALATAVFGTYEGHLNIVPISWAQRWPLLQSGELDVVVKSSDWTASRDSELGLQFSSVYVFTSQKVMAHKELGAETLADLDGGSICVPAGTSTEKLLASYLAAHGIDMEIIASEKTEESQAAYLSGRCDAYAEWDVQLAVARLNAENEADHVILPDTFAAGPCGMVVRENDDHWLDIVNFTLSTMLTAEQAGVTQANVDEMKANPPTPDIAKMLGVTPGYGSRVGLSDSFGYDIIKAVGNYNDVWERNLGQGSPYKLARGPNELWQNGGVLFPMIMD